MVDLKVDKVTFGLILLCAILFGFVLGNFLSNWNLDHVKSRNDVCFNHSISITDINASVAGPMQLVFTQVVANNFNGTVKLWCLVNK